MRVAPAWRDFVTGLGGTGIVIPAPEVYTALERGTVDGIGWTSIGIMDFSWDKHLKARIDPEEHGGAGGTFMLACLAVEQTAREFAPAVTGS